MLEIGNLYLKIPGLTSDEARSLAEEIARLLARQAGGLAFAARPQRIDHLEVSLRLAPETSRAQWAERIVQAILERLEE